jgi:sortase A
MQTNIPAAVDNIRLMLWTVGIAIILAVLCYSIGWLFRRKNLNWSWLSLLSLVFLFAAIGFGGQYAWQQNLFHITTTVQHAQKQQAYKRQQSNHNRYSKAARQKIEKMVMRNAQKGFEKQGFVAIPKVSILEPIYNDAYSVAGLNIGADYANKSQKDPEGKIKPVMGKSNYGLAAHNFNDGKTGFSGLQQYLNQNAPYLVNGQEKGSNWLNGVSVYLANAKGVYKYTITGQ